MKLLTREQLFAAPKLVSRAEERRARGIAAVSAAREGRRKLHSGQPKSLDCALACCTDARLERLRGQA